MNFYPHHIKDFNNSTRHLTRVERSVYRDAIELYYDTESPLVDDIDKLSRRLLVTSDEEKTALRDILNEFFELTKDGYYHDRCDKEIAKYRANTSAKARAGIASAAKRKQKSTGVEQVLNTRTTDEQLTSNHKPITNNHIKNIGRGNRLPQDWIVPEDYIKFCHEERPDLIAEDVALQFKDYWISVAGAKGVKTDWFATWRNWVRRQDVAKSKFKNKGSLMSDAQFEDWLTPKGVEYARIG
jgi:uncharacterized protein YdaU (DUF1376 family)